MIDYGGVCPFKVGDRIRLRNDPKDEIITIENPIRNGHLNANGAWYHDLVWRRFEYASDRSDLKVGNHVRVEQSGNKQLVGLVGLVIAAPSVGLNGHVDVRICGQVYCLGKNRLCKVTDPVTPGAMITAGPIMKPVPVPIRCGACLARGSVAANSYSQHFDNGGVFAYPVRNVNTESASHCQEQIELCPACAESVAKHIQYLKVNYGPTRTGRV